MSESRPVQSSWNTIYSEEGVEWALTTPYPKGGEQYGSDQYTDGETDPDTENPHWNNTASQFAQPKRQEFYYLEGEIVYRDA